MVYSFEQVESILDSLFEKVGKDMSPDDWADMQEDILSKLGWSVDQFDTACFEKYPLDDLSFLCK
jgi:hypothetical protein